MSLRIVEIPYLNCAPFYWNKDLKAQHITPEWIWAHPKKLGDLARVGLVDAGPVSLLDTLELEENFELLDFGISAKNCAQSVLLFSKIPLTELEKKQVGLTTQSSTSIELLDVLCRERLRVDPVFSPGFSDQDIARLWIGDQALMAALDPVTIAEFPHRMDLGEAWKDWKGHPFVFARWMMKKNLNSDVKTLLKEWLSNNVAAFNADPALAISSFEMTRGWKLPESRKYLEGFKYAVEESDYLGSLAALSQFSSRLAASKS